MNYNDIIKEELKPAFGCTEPIALAYTSAKAANILGEKVKKIIAYCSGNIIKNTKSVIVPGTFGEKGIEISCILGAIAGDYKKELEVLSGIDKKYVKIAKELRDEKFCEVNLVPGVENLFIKIEAFGDNHSSSVTIQGTHTNIIEIIKDGEFVFKKDLDTNEDYATLDYKFDEIYEFSKRCDYSSIKNILDKQIEYNFSIAEEGLNNNYGSNIGKLVYRENGDVENKMVALAAAGSDARMAGSEMPVVINSGSGNQGITVSVPIIVYAKEKNYSDDKLYRALIFANLIGEYLKAKIGRLSAYCGVVSAASASISGVAFLKDESKKVISDTLINSLAGNSGIICDGAKASCAMKIRSSLENALLAYKQAKTNNSFLSGDGIVKEDIDKTIETVGNIARYGMYNTDIVILQEMLNNKEYISKLKYK